MAKINKSVPGSIKIRTTKNGSEYIYVRCYGDKKFIATGLKNTKENLLKAEKILKIAYLEDKKAESSPKITASMHSIIEKYIEYKTYKKLSNITIKNIRYVLYKVFAQDFDYNKITVVNGKSTYYFENIIEEYIFSKSDKSSGYTNLFAMILNAFIKWMYEEEYINKYNSVNKKYRRKVKPDILVYSEDESKRIFHFLLSYRWRNKYNRMMKKYLIYAYLFLFYTGARKSEGLEIKWSQINFEKRYIAFPNKGDKNKNDYFPISAKLMKLLLNLKAMETEEEYPEIFKDNVFKFAPSFFANKLIFILKKLGMKQKKKLIHSIRKSFATKLFELRDTGLIDSYQVMELIRHKDINLTKEVYRQYQSTQMVNLLDKAGI